MMHHGIFGLSELDQFSQAWKRRYAEKYPVIYHLDIDDFGLHYSRHENLLAKRSGNVVWHHTPDSKIYCLGELVHGE